MTGLLDELEAEANAPPAGAPAGGLLDALEAETGGGAPAPGGGLLDALEAETAAPADSPGVSALAGRMTGGLKEGLFDAVSRMIPGVSLARAAHAAAPALAAELTGEAPAQPGRVLKAGMEGLGRLETLPQQMAATTAALAAAGGEQAAPVTREGSRRLEKAKREIPLRLASAAVGGPLEAETPGAELTREELYRKLGVPTEREPDESDVGFALRQGTVLGMRGLIEAAETIGQLTGGVRPGVITREEPAGLEKSALEEAAVQLEAPKLYEAITGRRWLTPEEVSALGAKDPNAARDVRRRQGSVVKAIGSELLDLKKAVAEVPVMGAKGLVRMGQRVREGDLKAAAAGPAEMVKLIGAEMAESASKTLPATLRGEVRREAPVGQTLDLLGGLGNAVGAGAARSALKAARAAGKGPLEATKAAARAYITGQAHYGETARETVGRMAASSPITSGRAGVSRELLGHVDEARFERAAGAERAAELAEPITELAPASRVKTAGAVEAGVEAIPEIRTTLKQQRELKRIAEDPELLGSERYRELREAVEARGAGILDEATEVDRLKTILSPEYERLYLRHQALRERAAGLAEDVPTAEAAAARRATSAETAELERVKAAQRVEDVRGAAKTRAIEKADEATEVAEVGADVARRTADEAQGAVDDAVTAARGAVKDAAADRRMPTLAAAAEKATRKVDAEIAKAERALPAIKGRELGAMHRRAMTGIDDHELSKWDAAVAAGQKLTHEQRAAAARTLEAVNEHLGLLGAKQVTTSFGAWRALMRDAESAADINRAVEVMREVTGLENYARQADILPHSYLLNVRELADLKALRSADIEAARLDIALKHAARGKRTRARDARMRQLGAAKERLKQAEKDFRARRGDVRAAEKATTRAEKAPAPPTRKEVVQARALGRRAEAAVTKKVTAERAASKAEKAAEKARKAEEAAEAARPELKPLEPAKERMAKELERLDESAEARGVPKGDRPSLKLGDDLMNTTDAALKGLGRDRDLRAAVVAGELRFEGGNPVLRQQMNERLLPIIAEQAELAKEKARLGLVADDQVTAALTNYMRAFYDPVKRQRYISAQAAALIEDARLKGIKALKEGADRADVQRAYQKAIDEAAKMLGQSAGSIARKQGPVGPVSVKSLQRASAKYYLSPEAQLERGRIAPEKVDQAFLTAVTESHQLVAEHRLFEKVASDRKLVHSFEVDDAAIRLEKAGRPWLREQVEAVTRDGQTYIRVPDSTIRGTPAKRYGKLSGKWLKKRDYEHLIDAVRLQRTYWNRIVQAWKSNKVINNLSSHLNIVTGNMVNQAFVDGGGMKAVADLPKAYTTIRARGPRYRAALRSGLGIGTQLREEIELLGQASRGGRDFLDIVINEARAAAVNEGKVRAYVRTAKKHGMEGAVTAYEVATHEVFGLGGRMRRLFDAHEMASRYALWERYMRRAAKKRGKKLDDVLDDAELGKKASEHARQIQLDYSDLPRWAQWVRGAPLVGMPFISYPVKATGLFTRTAVSRPWTTRSLLAAAEAAYDSATPEEKKRRDLNRKYLRGLMTTVGKQDLHVKQVSPVEFFPITEFLSPGSGSATESAHALLSSGGGPGQSILELKMNYGAFYGRPILTEEMSDTEKLRASAWWILRDFGPGTWTTAIDQVLAAYTGELDDRRRERNFGQALARMFGVKLSSSKTAEVLHFALKDYERLSKNIHKDYRRKKNKLGKDPDPDALARLQRERDEKLRRARVKFIYEKGPKGL